MNKQEGSKENVYLTDLYAFLTIFFCFEFMFSILPMILVKLICTGKLL